jgi:hypothetical protein
MLQERSEDISSLRRGRDNDFGMDGSSDPDVWHVWVIVAGQPWTKQSPDPK